MNRRVLCGVVAVLGAAFAVGGDAERLEEFLRFAYHGILDVNGVSDEHVHQVLAAGIASDDRRIVNLTLTGLNTLAYQRDPIFRRAQAYGIPIRPIARVPGLKRFLIDYWHTHLTGGDHEVALDIPRPDWWPILVEGRDSDHKVDLSSEDYDQLWEMLQTGPPQWHGIPLILAAHWPRDPDVLNVVWEAQELYRHAEIRGMGGYNDVGMTRRLLDVGEFDTPEANAFREAHPRAEEGHIDEQAVSNDD